MLVKMETTLTTFCVSLCGLVVLGAPTSNCPPGGKYFDKHLGKNGRWQCCSELCEALVYTDLCQLKCPEYEQSKAVTPVAHKVEQPSPKAADTSAGAGPAPIIAVMGVFTVVLLLGGFLYWRRQRQQNGRQGRGRTADKSVMLRDLQGGPRPSANPALTQCLLDPSVETPGQGQGQGQAEGGTGRADHTEPKDRVCGASSAPGRDFQTAKVEGGAPVQVEDQEGSSVSIISS